jgi:hypothetical protein
MTVQKISGPTRGANGLTYEVQTDLDPQMLTTVGLAIYKRWVEFAMGRAGLNGRTLMHPTGRYASSIRFKQTGVASVAIFAIEQPLKAGSKYSIAGLIEEGHDKVDLKTYFARGKVFRIDRGAKTGKSGGPSGYEWSGEGHMSPRRNMAAFNKRDNIWAARKQHGFTGFARLGGDPEAWVIPAMPAYSPAKVLVDLLKEGDFHDIQ